MKEFGSHLGSTGHLLKHLIKQTSSSGCGHQNFEIKLSVLGIVIGITMIALIVKQMHL